MPGSRSGQVYRVLDEDDLLAEPPTEELGWPPPRPSRVRLLVPALMTLVLAGTVGCVLLQLAGGSRRSRHRPGMRRVAGDATPSLGAPASRHAGFASRRDESPAFTAARGRQRPRRRRTGLGSLGGPAAVRAAAVSEAHDVVTAEQSAPDPEFGFEVP